MPARKPLGREMTVPGLSPPGTQLSPLTLRGLSSLHSLSDHPHLAGAEDLAAWQFPLLGFKPQAKWLRCLYHIAKQT